MDTIADAKIIFWDFDGVIKESVEVKTKAYADLFRSYGDAIADQVQDHHLKNGGVSRFEKIPLYMHWAGVGVDAANVGDFCSRFSQLVLQSVIEAPWVEGVERLLRTNPLRQTFILVSATPIDELRYILHALNLSECFSAVYGAPTSKKEAIRMTLEDGKYLRDECLMIGDALADMEAAKANDVPFLLRRHNANADLFSTYTGQSIKDFSKIWTD